MVEAEKVAEANGIRRREETSATRSLLNAAKVMEGNPTALRLEIQSARFFSEPAPWTSFSDIQPCDAGDTIGPTPPELFAMTSRLPDGPLDLERVRLRAIEDSDVDALFSIYSDSEVARYLSHPAWVDRAEAVTLVKRIHAGNADGTTVQLGIERKEDRALMGLCLLFHFHDASRRAEIGYALGRAYWGRGYMHEALTGLVEFAFGALGLNRLEADIDPANLASARSLERLGFAKEGYMRERWIVAGEVSDTAFFGLLRREWLKP